MSRHFGAQLNLAGRCPVDQFEIRPTTLSDTAEISRSKAEPGYDADAEQISTKLAFLLPNTDHFIGKRSINGTLVS